MRAKKPAAIFTVIALILAVGFVLGNLVIEASWKREQLSWLSGDSLLDVRGVRPGVTRLNETVSGLGQPEYRLAASPFGLNVELVFPQAELDNDTVTLLVRPDTAPARQAELLLQVRASGVYTDEELASGSVPFTRLDDPAYLEAVVGEVIVVPVAPVDHERVIKAYGRPKVTMGTRLEETGGDVSWLYPRSGLTVHFLEQQAIRFNYVNPDQMMIGRNPAARGDG